MSSLTLAQPLSDQARPYFPPSHWTSSPHRHVPLPLTPSFRPSNLPRAHPILFPSSPLRQSLVPSLPIPLVSIAVPATASIPNMPLPPPLNQDRTHNNSLSEAPWSFSLTSRRSTPVNAILHIPPAPPNTLFAASTVSGETVPPGMGGFSFGDWAPSSFKDLRSLARSLDGSTIKPVPIPLTFGNDNVEEDIGFQLLENHQGSFEFERKMREIEQELKEQPISTPTPSRGSRGSTTVKAGPVIGRRTRYDNGLMQGIDELDVEWCLLCGKEGQRDRMLLKRMNSEGWQWICQSCS
ncbi:hypothetical protein I307_01510 [Cryptococcus deuterogattii 99/473]|uniref:Uncharacterized protein n=1 Tax=Cryptococcus deuterogattii Ram5 TaxID=1296110 RepID=A0A0D0TUT8_9TREE|nr:hypothetical protein I313_04654 [Cryptococcus deuterogattii Ram5]KIY59258.1 hypothetical protein I307_01510 [Cryptococcus deuterogattii 99/473]